MTHYKTLNIKLSNQQLNKFKSRIKDGTVATLNFYQMLLVILTMRITFPISYY